MNTSRVLRLLRHSAGSGRAFRRCSSHLVSAGDLGENKVLVLKPDVNFDAIFGNSQELAASLVRRGVEVDEDGANESINRLSRKWREFQADKEEIQRLEKEKNVMRERISGGGVGSKEEIARINQQLVPMKKRFWECQRSLLPELIHLPNGVHERTPDELQVLNDYCVANPWQKLLGGGSNFTGIEKRSMKPRGHFFLGEAAFTELEMTQQCREVITNRNFHPISPPDTVTPSVAEATYGLEGLSDLLRIKTDESYLPGSASLAAMCSLFARRSTRPEVGLPLRLFSTGTVYDQLGEKTGCGMLTLMGDKGEEAVDSEFDSSVNSIVDTVVSFGCNCRTVAAPASDLAPRQTRRVDVEILLEPSVWRKIGYVEDCSDYVSRRLLMRYQRRGDQGNHYLRVVYGFLSFTDIIMGYVELK